jgi:hypothetical protein
VQGRARTLIRRELEAGFLYKCENLVRMNCFGAMICAPSSGLTTVWGDGRAAGESWGPQGGGRQWEGCALPSPPNPLRVFLGLAPMYKSHTHWVVCGLAQSGATGPLERTDGWGRGQCDSSAADGLFVIDYDHAIAFPGWGSRVEQMRMSDLKMVDSGDRSHSSRRGSRTTPFYPSALCSLSVFCCCVRAPEAHGFGVWAAPEPGATASEASHCGPIWQNHGRTNRHAEERGRRGGLA